MFLLAKRLLSVERPAAPISRTVFVHSGSEDGIMICGGNNGYLQSSHETLSGFPAPRRARSERSADHLGKQSRARSLSNFLAARRPDPDAALPCFGGDSGTCAGKRKAACHSAPDQRNRRDLHPVPGAFCRQLRAGRRRRFRPPPC